MVNGLVYSVVSSASGRLTRKTSAQMAAPSICNGPGNQPAEHARGHRAGGRMAVQVPQPRVQQRIAEWPQPAVVVNRLVVGQVFFQVLAHGLALYYCRMRLNILAFAAGIIALQMQPELPTAWPWALAGLAVGAAGDPLAGRAGRRVLSVCWPAWRSASRGPRGAPTSAWPMRCRPHGKGATSRWSASSPRCRRISARAAASNLPLKRC